MGEEVQKSANGLGIAGFILSLIGVIFSWIPVANIFGVVLCGLGFFLCFVGLFLRNRRKDLAVVGLLLAIAGIVVFYLEWSAILGNM